MRREGCHIARSISPLRYPGGKACLYPLVASLLKANKLQRRHYAEPFAGGCGLALALLYGGHVSDVHINDLDPSIWAFWHSVLHHPEEFVERILTTPITTDEWRRQRAIHQAQDESDSLALGFSAFFLNRTNRSGIISGAGVIGGLGQAGTYKIDCRFNKENLARRIRRVAKYKRRIHLTKLDALAFLSDTRQRLPEKAFFCIDPPYFEKGSHVYTNFYSREDHALLAREVLVMQQPWIVTYDNAQPISRLYRSHRQFQFDISYSLATKRRATELLIASKGLRIPGQIRERFLGRTRSCAA